MQKRYDVINHYLTLQGLNLTTEVEWLIPNLILRSGLILHAAAALHCKTTRIFHAARRCWSNRVRCAAAIFNFFYNKNAVGYMKK